MNLMADTAPEWQRLGFVPGVTLRLFGMRRSGNHAMTSWLQRNAPSGHALFLNNCKRGRDPFDTFASVEVDNRRVAPNAARKDMAAIGRRAGDGALFLVSYEDCAPEGDDEKPVSGSFDSQLIHRDILIYRSFLNWIASLTKKLQLNETLSVTRRASLLLRAIDVYRRFLEFVDSSRGGKSLAVCFDRWVSDADHRSDLLDQLGFPERDNGLGDVQSYGGGSSFQKETNDADELKTDHRWMQMAEDAEYRSVLAVSARDDALTQILGRFFPRDQEILGRIWDTSVFDKGALA